MEATQRPQATERLRYYGLFDSRVPVVRFCLLVAERDYYISVVHIVTWLTLYTRDSYMLSYYGRQRRQGRRVNMLDLLMDYTASYSNVRSSERETKSAAS